MSRTEGCLEVAWQQSFAHIREYLNHVVQEIRWANRLDRFNHCLHFPFFMTHFTDPMPISSIGGIVSADLWDPKYVSHVYKVTVAIDMLGNIICICPLAPGTSTDVLIWDGYGPSRTRVDFFDFEVGGHDGAYKGQIHVIVPFIGRVPPHVWTDKSNLATTQDEAEDEAKVCVLCCEKRSIITICGECEEHYCAECIDTTLVGPMLLYK